MKSLEELKALREQMKGKVGIRHDGDSNIRVVVGMATCGIAAGGRPVLAAFTDEVAMLGLTHVSVGQTGCIGICQYEPVVDIFEPEKEKVTYVKVTPEMVPAIVSQHIVNGSPVTEYTIGASGAQS